MCLVSAAQTPKIKLFHWDIKRCSELFLKWQPLKWRVFTVPGSPTCKYPSTDWWFFKFMCFSIFKIIISLLRVVPTMDFMHLLFHNFILHSMLPDVVSPVRFSFDMTTSWHCVLVSGMSAGGSKSLLQTSGLLAVTHALANAAHLTAGLKRTRGTTSGSRFRFTNFAGFDFQILQFLTRSSLDSLWTLTP